MAYGKEAKVRKSISSSISEIAHILGKEITEKELIPVFEKLYKEEGEIQNTILKNIPKFLKEINPDLRKGYLEKLKRMLNPWEKWRVRQTYSKIIGEFHDVYDDEVTYKQILPINLHFCLDDVTSLLLYLGG